MGRATQMENRPRHGPIPQAVQAAVRARLEKHVQAHWKDRCREVEEILRLTVGFCTDYLDGEYSELCRKLVGELARKRPSPLLRGDLRIWVGAVIYTIGSINFLFDKTQRPHLTADQLSQRLGLSKSTLSAKAKRIHDLLRIVPFEPRYCRRTLFADNPLAWMISVNGFLVDARTMPPEIQAEARRRGLIPDLSAETPASTEEE